MLYVVILLGKGGGQKSGAKPRHSPQVPTTAARDMGRKRTATAMAMAAADGTYVRGGPHRGEALALAEAAR